MPWGLFRLVERVGTVVLIGWADLVREDNRILRYTFILENVGSPDCFEVVSSECFDQSVDWIPLITTRAFYIECIAADGLGSIQRVKAKHGSVIHIVNGCTFKGVTSNGHASAAVKINQLRSAVTNKDVAS